MKRGILHRANGTAVVYLLWIEGGGDKAFKVGYSSNLQERLAYYPQWMNVTVLNYITGRAKDMKKLEAFIHKHADSKHEWTGTYFPGYTETYDEEVNLRQWEHILKNGFPNVNKERKDEMDDFLTI